LTYPEKRKRLDVVLGELSPIAGVKWGGVVGKGTEERKGSPGAKEKGWYRFFGGLRVTVGARERVREGRVVVKGVRKKDCPEGFSCKKPKRPQYEEEKGRVPITHRKERARKEVRTPA